MIPRLVMPTLVRVIAAIALCSTTAFADLRPIGEAEFATYLADLSLDTNTEAVAVALYEGYAKQAARLRAARDLFFDWSGGPLSRSPHALEYAQLVSQDHRRLDAVYRAVLIDLDNRLFADLGHVDALDAISIRQALMARRRARSLPSHVPDLRQLLSDLGFAIDEHETFASLLRTFEDQLDRELQAYETVLKSEVVIDRPTIEASGDIEELARSYREPALAVARIRRQVITYRNRLASAFPAETRHALLTRVNAVLYHEVRRLDRVSGPFSKATEDMDPDDDRFGTLEQLRAEWIVVRDAHFERLDALYDAGFARSVIEEEAESIAVATIRKIPRGVPTTRREFVEAQRAFSRDEREFGRRFDANMASLPQATVDVQEAGAIAPAVEKVARSFGGPYSFDLLALVDESLGDNTSDDYAALRARYRTEYDTCIELIATEGEEHRSRIAALLQTMDPQDEAEIKSHIRELERMSWAIDSLNRRWVARVYAAVDESHHHEIRVALRRKKYEAYFRRSPAETVFAWAREQGIPAEEAADLHAAYSTRIESINRRLEHLLDEINTLERALEGTSRISDEHDRLRESITEVLLTRYAAEQNTLRQLRTAIREHGVSAPPEIELFLRW